MVSEAGLDTASAVVDHFLGRLMAVPVSAAQRSALVEVLERHMGTSSVAEARSYLEDPLRELVFRIMSLPEYQLG